MFNLSLEFLNIKIIWLLNVKYLSNRNPKKVELLSKFITCSYNFNEKISLSPEFLLLEKIE